MPALPTSRRRFWQALFGLLSLTAAPLLSRAEDTTPHAYVVLTGFDIAEGGKLQNFKLRRIIEPLAGEASPKDITLPKDFLEQAKKALESDHAAEAKQQLGVILHVPEPKGGPAPALSLRSLEGVIGSVADYTVDGQPRQGLTFGKDLHGKALFLAFHILPTPATDAAGMKKAADDEITRCLANINGTVLERTEPALPGQAVVEVVVKHPRSSSMLIRCRAISNGKDVLSVSVVGPNELSAEDSAALKALYQAFRFAP